MNYNLDCLVFMDVIVGIIIKLFVLGFEVGYFEFCFVDIELYEIVGVE